MVHYSSRVSYYEGGAKNPLKGIHEASCLCAKCQFCVFAGSKILGKCVMAYIFQPYYRGGLKRTTF